MEKHKFILPISILLGCIILGGFLYTIQIKKQRPIQSEKQSYYQPGDRCYSYEDKKCITKEEKEIIKLLPNDAILREIEPVPLEDMDIFIGIYIENPVIEAPSTEKYLTCSDVVRGQGISGIYHLFTYYAGYINSDIIIPKSTSFDDYNNDISAQRISMPWRNTKWNNFNNFNGKPFSKKEEFDLEISNLINFKDYNGDSYPYEFILFGGEYWDCSRDENLIGGYDKENISAIIYKIMDESNKPTYWGINFFPEKNGDVINKWPCGDHGSEVETNVFYKYDRNDKYYYFVNSTSKKCN